MTSEATKPEHTTCHRTMSSGATDTEYFLDGIKMYVVISGRYGEEGEVIRCWKAGTVDPTDRRVLRTLSAAIKEARAMGEPKPAPTTYQYTDREGYTFTMRPDMTHYR